MFKEKEQFIKKTIILLDALVIAGAFWLSFLVRKQFHYIYKLDLFPYVKVVPKLSASLSEYTVVLFAGIFIWCLALYSAGAYKSKRTSTFFEIIWVIIKSAFITTICFSTLVYLLKIESISRLFFSIFIAIGAMLLALEKLTFFYLTHYLRRRGYNFRRLLAVGTGKRVLQFVDKLDNHPEWGLKLFGTIDDEGNYPQKNVGSINVLGKMGDLPRIIRSFCIDEVVFMVPRAKLGSIEEAMLTCETMGIKATIALDLFDLKLARARQTELDGIPFITFETISTKEWQILFKRGFDLILSVLGIVILSPVLLLSAFLIKFTSEGPVFFLQKRLGLNGRKFVLYKFRTMYKGAHRMQRELLKNNLMQGGPAFKIKNDPRITPIGKFLRKFSIDELPQLFNVFLGHMSLVGPRPPVQREVKQYEQWQRRRLSMSPGITCLWQISGRNNIVDFNEWMKLDLQYIDKWSLWLDIKVLCKTIPAVLSSTGAY